MLIDAHCHIASLSDEEKKFIFLSSAPGYIFVDSSINLETSLQSVNFCTQYPNVYSALGFHPFYVKGFRPQILKSYQEFIAKNKKVIAIGEIGLDNKAEAHLVEQENIFRIFLKLAKEVSLPVLIHSRLEKPAIFSVIDDFFPDYGKVVFHCFSYPAQVLKTIIEKGGHVSFSLNILRNKKNITESLIECPLDKMLLETDSPYMKINERASTPFDIKEVYAYVASLKKIEQKNLEEIIFANFKKVFSL